VSPPSVDTSTAATWPPPASVAVPLIVTSEPLGIEAPAAGAVIVAVGGSVSVVGVGMIRPARSVVGLTPMSVNMFSVAWRIRVSAAGLEMSCRLSSPHDHWTVPEPQTSAPLGAR
jgi:hypothetical protein